MWFIKIFNQFIKIFNQTVSANTKGIEVCDNTKGLGVCDNIKGDIKANNICSYTLSLKVEKFSNLYLIYINHT